MSTTTDADRLLRAVLLDPADDTTRLILADCFEEQGEVQRAEFIRANIVLYNQPGRKSLIRMLATGKSWRLMLDASLCDRTVLWQNKEHDHRVTDGKIGVRFCRGFVESIRLRSADFLHPDVAKGIFERHPVTSVTLIDKQPRWDGLQGGHGWVCDARPGDTKVYSSMGQHYLCRPLYDMLEDNRSVWRKWYGTEPDAVADLQRACVRLGRSLAGLPPLPVGTSG